MKSSMNRWQTAVRGVSGFVGIAVVVMGCAPEVRNYESNATGTSSSSSTASSSGSGGGMGGAGGGTGGIGTGGIGTGGIGGGGGGTGGIGTGGAGGSVPETVFDEGLATILRGIEIDAVAAASLGVPKGYYRLREFRSVADTSKSAVALELERAYGACSDPTKSIVPTSSQMWVFWQRDTYEYNADHFVLKTRDAFNNSLDFEILFTSNCFTVNFSVLNGMNIQLTAQKYTTEELYTCNYPVEPTFSMPPLNCL